MDIKTRHQVAQTLLQAAALLSASKLDDILKANPDLEPELKEALEQINKADPSPTKKYLLWGFQQVKDGQDTKEVIDVIDRYHSFLPRLSGKDKDIYSFKSVDDLLGKLDVLAATPSRSQKSKKATAHTLVLFDDERWRLVHPLTTQAAIKAGRNTDWCIARDKSDNHFFSYTSNNIKFYILTDKQKKPRSDRPDWSKTAFLFVSGKPNKTEPYQDAANTGPKLPTVREAIGDEIFKRVTDIAAKHSASSEDTWQYKLTQASVPDAEKIALWKKNGAIEDLVGLTDLINEGHISSPGFLTYLVTNAVIGGQGGADVATSLAEKTDDPQLLRKLWEMYGTEPFDLGTSVAVIHNKNTPKDILLGIEASSNYILYALLTNQQLSLNEKAKLWGASSVVAKSGVVHMEDDPLPPELLEPLYNAIKSTPADKKLVQPFVVRVLASSTTPTSLIEKLWNDKPLSEDMADKGFLKLIANNPNAPDHLQELAVPVVNDPLVTARYASSERALDALLRRSQKSVADLALPMSKNRHLPPKYIALLVDILPDILAASGERKLKDVLYGLGITALKDIPSFTKLISFLKEHNLGVVSIENAIRSRNLSAEAVNGIARYDDADLFAEIARLPPAKQREVISKPVFIQMLKHDKVTNVYLTDEARIAEPFFSYAAEAARDGDMAVSKFLTELYSFYFEKQDREKLTELAKVLVDVLDGSTTDPKMQDTIEHAKVTIRTFG